MFKIIKKDKNSQARTGVIQTAHGIIETPAYAIVGTHGAVRCLPAWLLPASKTRLIIANTYHLWQKFKGQDGHLENLPDIHRLMDWSGPTMTDSGGFQVFSLGFSREHGVGKISNIFPESREKPATGSREKNLVRIASAGVWFKINGQEPEEFLGPELSIQIQERLGADIILAFDECTSPFHSYQYTAEAMERTHRWAKRCLETRTKKNQLLYGIVQGGEFRDLREISARFINSLPFEGIAIGGSLGRAKKTAFDVLEWTVPFLNEERPRHFLGIGKIEDILDGVAQGIDTFDCVIPTREARHGRLWTSRGYYDITKTVWKDSPRPPDPECSCLVCQKFTRADLHRQFKDKAPEAGQNATFHNVFFFNHFMKRVREAIKENRFAEFRKECLAKPHETKSRPGFARSTALGD